MQHRGNAVVAVLGLPAALRRESDPRVRRHRPVLQAGDGFRDEPTGVLTPERERRTTDLSS